MWGLWADGQGLATGNWCGRHVQRLPLACLTRPLFDAMRDHFDDVALLRLSTGELCSLANSFGKLSQAGSVGPVCGKGVPPLLGGLACRTC